jgi:DNA polymerase I
MKMWNKCLYGSSTGGIAKQLNLSTDEAQRLIDMYFKAFPGVKNYIDQSHKFALLNQFSLTPLGQIKRQFGTYQCFRPTASYNASLRNAQNVIIQSTTSSIGLVTFAELNRRIKPLGAISTCTVFDSVEMEVPIDRVAEVVDIAFDTLDNYPLEVFPFLQLPVGCECEIGESWGNLETVHPGLKQEAISSIYEKTKQASIKEFGTWIP